MNFAADHFSEKGSQTLKGMAERLAALPTLAASELDKGQTALVVIDMINGFVREGALQSGRVEELVSPVVDLMNRLKGVPVIIFADNHGPDSLEFASYPPHCLKDTAESQVVDEIKENFSYELIAKNSTNGFLTCDFQAWLPRHPQIKNFVVAGDCTDICIYQFSVTLKAYFNEHNERARVIVPVNAVDTFDLGLHDGDLMNVVSLCSMIDNGVEVVKGICR